jgi:hypothetical protein
MSEVAKYLAGVSSTWFSDAELMQAYTNTQNLANIWKHGG